MPVADTGSSWADQVEAGEEGALPPTSEKIVNNIKTIVEHKRNDEGKIVKVTRTYKIEKRRVPKAVAQRKHWRKFGQAQRDGPGPNPSTTAVADDVFLTLTTNKEQLEQEEDTLKTRLQKQTVTCRICKGDHWTTKCPYKDTLGDAPATKDPEAQADAAPAAAAATGATAGQKYVPPSQRGDRSGVAGVAMGRGRDDNGAGVRVSNLSEETTEQDLQELFKPFGRISRIYLAKDKITQQSKGFAFVTYYDRDDAARAIRGLQGFGYDHLILNLEWAK